MSASAALALVWPLLTPGALTPESTQRSGLDTSAVTEPAAAEDPTSTTSETPAPLPDYAEQAPLDVDTLLADTSRAYLDARARLEAHPELAAEAILDRLSAVPPPTGTDRKRLLDVLAALGLPDHVEMFAAELRRGVLRDDANTEQTKAVGRWLPLLVDQGAAAVGPLTTLVADKQMPLTVRAKLLDALVDVTPSADLPNLIALVGRGARPLRQQLHRSLGRRAKANEPVRTALLRAVDETRAKADAKRMPALLVLRAALTAEGDDAFTQELGALARDSDGPFGLQITAVRALADLDTPPSHEALVGIATQALGPELGKTQRGELLAWAALTGLPQAQAQPLVDTYRLAEHGAPRLAVLGLTWAKLPADESWLPAALDNPWPTVRQAALTRVEGPCESSTVRLLGQKAHLAGRKSEDDRAVARGAIVALGRCTASDRLANLLADEQLDVELRGEAARQLARLGDDGSIEAIGKVLRHHPDRILARRLVSALRHMPKATEAGDNVLCEAATRDDEAGHAARETLLRLHDDPDGICE